MGKRRISAISVLLAAGVSCVCLCSGVGGVLHRGKEATDELPRQPASRAVFQAMAIAVASHDQVASVLGSPVRSTSLSSEPGEIRDYDLGSGVIASVKFASGRAVSVVVLFDTPPESPDAALERVGIDPASLSVVFESDAVKRYRGNCQDVAVEAIATKSGPSQSQGGQDEQCSQLAVKFQ